MANRAIMIAFCLSAVLRAQDVELRLYSEFQRLAASGTVIAADRGEVSHEIISPALVRNGFTTFHIAVTGRPRILYWVAIQTNPSDVFRIRVYKELRGPSSIPDRLVEEPKPLFFLGIMPDVSAPMVTDVYLLDVWTPPDVAVDRIRFEVLVKTGDWIVAPMEVRLMPVRVPNLAILPGCCAPLPSPQMPASSFAWEPLFYALTGGPAPRRSAAGTVRSIIRRNAMQDAAIVRSLDESARNALFERVWPVMAGTLLNLPASIRPGAESYIPLRQFIFRAAAQATSAAPE